MNKKAAMNGVPAIPTEEDAKEVDFEPLWDYCLLRPIKQDRTKGGVLLPEGSRIDDCPKAEVVKAGKGTMSLTGAFIPNPIQVGDMVYSIGNNSGWIIVLNGKQYMVIGSKDCVAITKRKVEAKEDNLSLV